MGSFIDVAIIGAGPNGLSLAAHLRALGVEFRIFGKPMQVWREQMPPGMRLKSDGKSSDLSDVDHQLTLKKFCADAGIRHHDSLLPVELDTFIKYGMAFQQRFVPELEPKILTSLAFQGDRFRLVFDDEEIISAKRVVLAVGITHFAYLPEFLREIPKEFVTHASAYGTLERFSGETVTVLGAGASAIDLAGLLKDQRADVSLLTRRPNVEFHGPPQPGQRPLLWRLRAPASAMGAGWQLWMYGYEPRVFHVLPPRVRRYKARTMLGPSAGWFMRDRIVDRVPMLTGLTPVRAETRGQRLHIWAKALDGSTREVVTPHLISATGYRVDLRRIEFLSPNILARIKMVEHAPVLNNRFETSVPGLYTIGLAAMNEFGPLVRFVAGAGYQARRLSRHLANRGNTSRHSTSARPLTEEGGR